MTCDDFRSLLALLTVVRSREDLPSELRSHPSTCADCRNAVDERIAIDLLIDADVDIEPSHDLSESIFARTIGAAPAAAHGGVVHELPQRRPGPGPSRRLVASLGLAAAIALASTLFWNVRHSGTNGDRTKTSPPEADMIAHLDLLLDWETLDEHAADLDLITATDLMSAASGLEGG